MLKTAEINRFFEAEGLISTLLGDMQLFLKVAEIC
jgi:hypothetical protein